MLDKTLGETMYTTYLASMFRSIRFGINEAHGRGVAHPAQLLPRPRRRDA